MPRLQECSAGGVENAVKLMERTPTEGPHAPQDRLLHTDDGAIPLSQAIGTNVAANRKASTPSFQNVSPHPLERTTSPKEACLQEAAAASQLPQVSGEAHHEDVCVPSNALSIPCEGVGRGIQVTSPGPSSPKAQSLTSGASSSPKTQSPSASVSPSKSQSSESGNAALPPLLTSPSSPSSSKSAQKSSESSLRQKKGKKSPKGHRGGEFDMTRQMAAASACQPKPPKVEVARDLDYTVSKRPMTVGHQHYYVVTYETKGPTVLTHKFSDNPPAGLDYLVEAIAMEPWKKGEHPEPEPSCPYLRQPCPIDRIAANNRSKEGTSSFSKPSQSSSEGKSASATQPISSLEGTPGSQCPELRIPSIPGSAPSPPQLPSNDGSAVRSGQEVMSESTSSMQMSTPVEPPPSEVAEGTPLSAHSVSSGIPKPPVPSSSNSSARVPSSASGSQQQPQQSASASSSHSSDFRAPPSEESNGDSEWSEVTKSDEVSKTPPSELKLEQKAVTIKLRRGKKPCAEKKSFKIGKAQQLNLKGEDAATVPSQLHRAESYKFSSDEVEDLLGMMDQMEAFMGNVASKLICRQQNDAATRPPCCVCQHEDTAPASESKSPSASSKSTPKSPTPADGSQSPSKSSTENSVPADGSTSPSELNKSTPKSSGSESKEEEAEAASPPSAGAASYSNGKSSPAGQISPPRELVGLTQGECPRICTCPCDPIIERSPKESSSSESSSSSSSSPLTGLSSSSPSRPGADSSMAHQLLEKVQTYVNPGSSPSSSKPQSDQDASASSAKPEESVESPHHPGEDATPEERSFLRQKLEQLKGNLPGILTGNTQSAECEDEGSCEGKESSEKERCETENGEGEKEASEPSDKPSIFRRFLNAGTGEGEEVWKARNVHAEAQPETSAVESSEPALGSVSSASMGQKKDEGVEVCQMGSEHPCPILNEKEEDLKCALKLCSKGMEDVGLRGQEDLTKLANHFESCARRCKELAAEQKGCDEC